MKYTLAFDVYGTLINTSGIYNSLKILVGGGVKAFMDTWRNKQLEYSFRRSVMNRFADFSVCTKDALEFCCKTFKVDLTSHQREALMYEYTILPVYSDVEKGLTWLKELETKLYAFSNGSVAAVSQLLINANIMKYFEDIISVEAVKMFKPSPLVYEYFNRKTGSNKADSWLVSSNPFDVIGATSYGMNSAWLQRSPELVFDPWGIEPTLVIKDITDLCRKL